MLMLFLEHGVKVRIRNNINSSSYDVCNRSL